MGNLITNKIEQLLRLTYLNLITPLNKSVVLVEFPKSGGTWLGQLVSEYLEIPFPRNKFPSTKTSLFHGHYLPKHISKKNKIIFLARDGRDVLISYYHHQLIWNDKNKKETHEVNYHRHNVNFTDYENVGKNILSYMQYTYEHELPKTKRYVNPGNWSDYNKVWLDTMAQSEHIYMVQYEDLLENPLQTLKKLLVSFLDIETIDEEQLSRIIKKYSFENQTQRKQGEESVKSFLRKGIRGDWKNYFEEEEKQAFKKYAGDTLIALGYEKDDQW